MGGAYRGVEFEFQLHSREEKGDGMDLSPPPVFLPLLSSSHPTPSTQTHAAETHVPHDNTF